MGEMAGVVLGVAWTARRFLAASFLAPTAATGRSELGAKGGGREVAFVRDRVRTGERKETAMTVCFAFFFMLGEGQTAGIGRGRWRERKTRAEPVKKKKTQSSRHTRL
jgi:hypothetical protein